jgi:hypothetical protein
MLLEKNGRRSSSKRTKHINVRYFFVSNRIKSGEISTEHCWAADMVAAFSKPLVRLKKELKAHILLVMDQKNQIFKVDTRM